MNLYLVKLPEGVHVGYDEYDGAVIAAPDEETAKELALENCQGLAGTVELIGESHYDNEGIVLASFNAG